MLNGIPDYVTFNGRPNQYIDAPIKVKVGDRVRFWVVNAGPSHPCNFHVVGEQFDTVYLGAPPGSPIRGVQTWAVAPGGGMVFDLVCDVPGEFPIVNHGFGHGQKGGIGFLVVEPKGHSEVGSFRDAATSALTRRRRSAASNVRHMLYTKP